MLIAGFVLVAFSLCDAKRVKQPQQQANQQISAAETAHRVGGFSSDFGFYTLNIPSTSPVSWATPNAAWTSTTPSPSSPTSLNISFAFPFYGIPYRSLSIYPAGFISLAPSSVNDAQSTYYIAVLMVQLDVTSGLTFYDSGSSFTVQWIGARLLSNQTSQLFNFQVSLTPDGTIWMYYKTIPFPPLSINISCTIGLSDGYQRLYLDPTIMTNDAIIKLDAPYNYIPAPLSYIRSNSAVQLAPKKTCPQAQDCSTCISYRTLSAFSCYWCDALQLCTDGSDRFRNEVYLAGCFSDQTLNCTAPPLSTFSQYFLFNIMMPQFNDSCWTALSLRLSLASTLLLQKNVTKTDGSSVDVSFVINNCTSSLRLAVVLALQNSALLTCSGVSTPILDVSLFPRPLPVNTSSVAAYSSGAYAFTIILPVVFVLTCVSLIASVIVYFRSKRVSSAEDAHQDVKRALRRAEQEMAHFSDVQAVNLQPLSEDEAPTLETRSMRRQMRSGNAVNTWGAPTSSPIVHTSPPPSYASPSALPPPIMEEDEDALATGVVQTDVMLAMSSQNMLF